MRRDPMRTIRSGDTCDGQDWDLPKTCCSKFHGADVLRHYVWLGALPYWHVYLACVSVESWQCRAVPSCCCCLIAVVVPAVMAMAIWTKAVQPPAGRCSQAGTWSASRVYGADCTLQRWENCLRRG